MFRSQFTIPLVCALLLCFTNVRQTLAQNYKNVTLQDLSELPANGTYYVKHARVGNLSQSFGVPVGGAYGNKLITPAMVCGNLLCNQMIPKFSNGGILGVGFNYTPVQGYYPFSVNNFALNLGSFLNTPNYTATIQNAAEYDCVECLGSEWTYLDMFGYVCLGGDIQPAYKVYVGLRLLDDTKYPAASLTFGNANCQGTTQIITEGSCCNGSITAFGGDILQFTTQAGDHVTRIENLDDQFFPIGQYRLNTEAHGVGPIQLRTNFVYTAANIHNLGNGLTRSYPSNVGFNPAGAVIAKPAVSAGADQLVCDDSGDQNITGASPEDGSWSGSQLINEQGVFSTNAASVGDYVVTYSYTDENTGCTNTDTKSVTVSPRPVVNAGNDLSACDNSGIVVIGGASPNGGSWSGSQFLSGNQFNTTTANAGVHALTYSFTNVNGCTNSDVRNFNVLALPAVDAGADIAQCVNGGNVALSGQNPLGGYWSGSGVNGNTFNPAIPGVGLHNLTYTYTDGNECTNSDVRQANVIAAPAVSAGNDFEVCISLSPFALSGGSPENGTWSGPGVNAGVFSPAQAGVGTHAVTYQFTNQNGCLNTDTRSITVNALPAVNAGPDFSYCVNTPQFQITGANPGGGTWSGNGVNVNLFNPALAGVGAHVLTYNYSNNNGCENSDTRIFTVNPITPVDIAVDKIFCSSSGVYNLNTDVAAQHLGGTWSGSGVSGNNFNPGNVAPGAYTITYTFTNQFGCVSTQTKEFTVVPGPDVDAGPVLETCVNSAPVNLIGESPLGGTWSGPGVVNGNQFNPALNGVGVFNLTYTVISDVCTIADTRQVVVNNITPVDAGANVNKCSNSADFLLTGASAQGGVWSSPWVAGGFFSPASAGVGQHVVTYIYTNGDGCVSSDQRTVTINAAPTVDAGPDIQLCNNSGVYSLIADVNAQGGFFFGQGVQSLNFNPSVSGLGSHQVNYTNTDQLSGCSATDFRVITVVAPQSISVGNALTKCIDDLPFSLSGNESLPGGVWSGVGINQGEFSPALAGIGLHQPTYTAIDNNGCKAMAMRNISVVALPQVDAGQDIFVCNGAPLVPLNGSAQPIGGFFSGQSVLGNNFDVGNSGPGTFEVTYHYSDQHGCQNSDTKTIYVDAGASVDAGDDFSVCNGAALVNLSSLVTPGGGNFVGVGVSGTNFDPGVDPGTYNITYTLENQYGCSGSDEFQIEVNPLPAVNAGSSRSLCLNVAPYDLSLTAMPAGGSFAGPGVNDKFFEPSTAGIGAHVVYYTYTDSKGCSNTASRTITVTELPTVNAGANDFICLNEPLVDLTVGASPVNGTWTGTGVANGIFNPAIAGVGQHVLTYSITQGNGCSNADTRVITIFSPLQIDAGPDINICSNASLINLANGASVVGGAWSGTSVSQGSFNPAVGAGVYQVTLSYTDFYGCTDSDSKIVNVIAPQIVSVGSDQSICVTAPVVNLASTVFPPGGSFTGSGVSDNTFSPVLAGIGTHAVTYTVTDAQGCISSRVRNFNVTQPPLIDAGANKIVCLNSNILDLDVGTSVSGGTWSGNGTTGSFFNPSIAGLGAHSLTYTYNNGNGCISSDTRSLTVRENAVASAGADRTYCANAQSVSLLGEASPQGGTWSGLGVSNAVFTPGVAGVGTHTITYNYTDAFGCIAQDQKVIVVENVPYVSAGPGTEVCTTANAINLNQNVYPAGGSWSGPGITANYFHPQHTGAGVFSLNYSVTNANGCTSSGARSITVKLPPSINTGPDVTLCLNSLLLDLDDGNEFKGGTWAGTAVSYNQFDPAFAGLGNHMLSFTYDDGNGCISHDNKRVTVRPTPIVNAGTDLSMCVNNPPQSLAARGYPSTGTWSGTGVNQNALFTPGTAGVGLHTLSYRYTDTYGCSVTDYMNVNVHSLPAVDGGPATTVCNDNELVNLNQSSYPPGGSWTGVGVTGSNQFNPAQVGPGPYNLEYSFSDNHGCTAVDTRTLTVQTPPTVTAGADFEVCVNASPLNLSGASPSSGSWSGTGIISGVFDPLSAGIGTHVLYYSFTDNQGCSSSDNIEVRVLAEPQLSIGGDVVMCLNDLPLNLSTQATIKGGEFSGSGVTGNIFNASQAGRGVHVITYALRYNGCELFAFRNIIVHEPDEVEIGDNVTVCVATPPIDLITDTNVLGGYFSGNGVTGSRFDPQEAGVGSHVITYAHTNAMGCTSSAFKVITVQEQLPINAGADITLCSSLVGYELTGRGTPEGGIYVGQGVQNNSFNPNVTGLGSFTIEYVVDNGNGCVSRDEMSITVRQGSINNFGKDSIVCITASPMPLNFNAQLSGGLWNGNGVVSNSFYPTLAGLGPHVLSYKNQGLDCDIAGRRTITVIGLPKPSTSELKTVSGCDDSFIELIAKVSDADRENNVSVGWYNKGNSIPFTLGEKILYQVKGDEEIYFRSVSPFGCTSGQNDYIVVRSDNPSGDFYTDDVVIPFAKPIQFFPTKLENASGFRWDFGDGLYSLERFPWKYYYESGEFNVALTLTSPKGCETVITKDKYISVLPEPGRELQAPDPSGGRTKSDVVMITGPLPNPNRGKFSITIFTPFAGTFEITALNYVGQSFEIGAYELAEGENEIELDITNQNAGLYSIVIEGPNQTLINFKTVKQ